MRAAVACLLILVLGLSAGREKEASSTPVLLLPGKKRPFRLGLEVTNGKSSSADWEAFLDRLFDHFDRDGDGSLSRAEAGRLMPLPLPGGKELAIDFDKLDLN